MNKIYLTISFITFLFIISANAQLQFVRFENIPVKQNQDDLKFAWAGGFNCPQFSSLDVNGDGILDIVAFERGWYGSIKTFINGGMPNTIDLSFEWFHFREFPQLRNWALFYDYNCDGLNDIFTSVPAGIAVYKNVSNNDGNLKFNMVTPLLQTYGLNGLTNLFVSPPDIPAISDIDMDGDLDILTYEILGKTVEYHKNLSIENNGDCNSLEFELKNKCWGYFSENENSNSITIFDTCDENVSDPEKYERHAGSSLLAFDANDDGVKDMIIGDIAYNNMVFLSNGGNTSSASMIAVDEAFPSYNVPVDMTVFPAAYFLDVNNDDANDLLIAPNNPNTSQNYNHILYYSNEGSNTIPDFGFQQQGFLQDEMIDVGEGAKPVFFDYNADGLMDIVIGNDGYFIGLDEYHCKLMLLENIGTLENPSYEVITDDYLGLSAMQLNSIDPAFGDMDGDGDEDLILGDEEGQIHYFRNDAAPGSPAEFNLVAFNFMDIDVGQHASPQVVDVNRDDLPDFLIGEREGTLNYFENIGTLENPIFANIPTNDYFGEIDVMLECCTGYSVPMMVEDSLGDWNLFVGSEMGYLYKYIDIENNFQGGFTLVDSLHLNGENIHIDFADINNDSYPEVVYGEMGGGIGMLKNGSPQGLYIPEFVKKSDINIYPVPAKNYFYLTFNEVFPSEIDLRMYDLLGNEIEVNMNYNPEGQSLIYWRNIPDGFYFVRISTTAKLYSKRLLVRN